MERRQQILFWLKEVLSNNLNGISYHAFIFGSQANKTTLIRSDIDLGIIAEDEISNLQLSKIHAAIEDLPMLYKVDLVNFKDVDERFKSIALKNVEAL
jgi:predicted nucleotidyltransferase